MKHKYKHIHFVKADTELLKEEPYWRCKNNRSGATLGIVERYRHWNKYVFEPTAQTMFDTSCLQDIIHFMEQLKGGEDGH